MSDIKVPESVTPAQSETAFRSSGQRRVNIIWEVTQALIALVVTCSVIYASVVITLRSDMDKMAFLFLTNVAFTIIGFYFGRTNHQKVGGIGIDRDEMSGR